MAVRRLTPRECERLQSFPDDHTLIPWRGRPASECPDGPRYKALGNSMCVFNMRWIGRRIHNAIVQLERGLDVIENDATTSANQQEPPMSRAYTAEEARNQVLSHLRMLSKYWAEQPGLSVQDRTEGMAFSFLTMLDGSSSLPLMDVVIRSTKEDKAYHIEQGEDFYEDGTVINEDVLLHEFFYERAPAN